MRSIRIRRPQANDVMVPGGKSGHRRESDTGNLLQYVGGEGFGWHIWSGRESYSVFMALCVTKIAAGGLWYTSQE